MSRSGSWRYAIITILMSVGLIVAVDLLLGLAGVNREYRLSRPDRMHREDPELLFIERPNLSLDVPIHAGLVATTDPQPALATWHVQTNRFGMNEGEFSPHKPPGMLRIVSLGDSCTFGWGVERNQSYVKVMEQRLVESVDSAIIECLNAGHTGFTSFQGRILLDRVVRDWSPDIVTLSFGMNDHTIRGSTRSDKVRFEENRAILGRVRFGLGSSNLYLLGLRAFQKINPEQKPGRRSIARICRVSVEDFGDNLRLMAAIAREIGATAVFVSQPHQVWNDVDDRYAEQLNRVARELAVPLVDAAGRFKELQRDYGITREAPNRLFIDTIHPTVEGHAIIADLLVAAIRQTLPFQRLKSPSTAILTSGDAVTPRETRQ